ncbi:MAG: TRAP transporter fused permease subunit [Alphaproteobacteria bacterium]|nr:TRAP transporter fused permease subunit [Alphaproteobacteria bacterium]MBU0797272.1 TRAP transporter fused permease subunit [Alphaproteobacteria bacterium]MBU0888940.1 TRAP transporter fused permease subunit [Alphaproteobacteria bacterium]MBU1813960.1 TRAP transporter fused permease subunit [Alphaproteobacteria bacterium]
MDATAGLRSSDSFAGKIAFWFGIALAVLHIWVNTFGTISELWMAVLHFGGFGMLCTLLYPAWHSRTPTGRRIALTLDIVLGLAALSLFAYLVLGEPTFYARNGSFVWYDWIFTAMAVLLGIEFTRRTTGLIIPILIILAFTYVTTWGSWLPGMLTFSGLGFETMLFRSFYSDDGMFGQIAQISFSFVFMFILFGAFLVRSGAGDFIIDFARAVAGKMIGGPGFVAVIGSALMGTISGSAVANTVSTGVITIPLMKRAGFPAKFAAGVEATASTGGMLMPPIMGAGAFVMASYTQISYLTIAAVSLLPALLYFFGVACFVRVEAKKQNMRTTDEDAPPVLEVLKKGGISFFVPIGLLVYMLVDGFTPTYAAGYAILAAIAASWFGPSRMGPRAVLEAMATGAKNMVLTAVLLVSIGIVVNAVTITGIGNTFSLMINEWSGGNMLIALVLIALASLVLGMGLPVTASYIVLATLSAPALADMIVQSQLVTQFAAGNIPDMAKAVIMLAAPDQMASLGQPMSEDAARSLLAAIPPEMIGPIKDATLTPAILTTALLSAHMIIYWLSLDSNVTPPVCLTAFAAAAIAKSPPMATGFTAWKLAKTLYIVPVLFAYTPFLSGDYIVALEIFGFALIGIYALIGAMEGYLEGPVAWPLRIVLFAIGVTILWPNDWTVNLIGTALFLAFFAWNLRSDRRMRAAATA